MGVDEGCKNCHRMPEGDLVKDLQLYEMFISSRPPNRTYNSRLKKDSVFKEVYPVTVAEHISSRSPFTVPHRPLAFTSATQSLILPLCRTTIIVIDPFNDHSNFISSIQSRRTSRA